MRAFVVAVALGCLSLGSLARADDAPVIKLVDAGKAPRKALRFTAKAGTKRTMVMTMQMTMAMTMAGSALPAQKTPPIRITVDVTFDEVAANGDMRYSFALRKPVLEKDANVPQAVVDALRTAVADLAGIKGHAVISSRGFTKEADASAAPGASPQTQQMVESMRQALAQIAAPLPEEAVGVGAKWTTSLALRQSGMVLDQTATTELVELRGNRARFTVAISQSGKPQKFTSQGVALELHSYSGNGTGGMTFELPDPLPRQGLTMLHSVADMTAAGQKIGMILDVSMTASTK